MGFFSWMRHMRDLGLFAELVAGLGVRVSVEDMYFISSSGG